LEYKRKNYDKHKDKVNETRRTKYKEDEEYRKKTGTNTNNVCNSSMKAQCYSRHLKTDKHKRNLRTVNG